MWPRSMAKSELTLQRSFVIVAAGCRGGGRRPMRVWQEPLCIRVWRELGQQEADMTGSGGPVL